MRRIGMGCWYIKGKEMGLRDGTDFGFKLFSSPRALQSNVHSLHSSVVVCCPS